MKTSSNSLQVLSNHLAASGGSLTSLTKRAEQVRFAGKDNILLLDASYSMTTPLSYTLDADTRIDALWNIVQVLRTQGLSFTPISFGASIEYCELIKPIPEGSTPLAEAFDFIHENTKSLRSVTLITDGEPDNPITAMQAGLSLERPINVFFVGRPDDLYAKGFCMELAQKSGGQYSESALDTQLKLGQALETTRLMLTSGLTPQKGTINL